MALRLLGLNAGSAGGNTEIVLKVALRAAEAEGAVVELIRLDELSLPSGPDPKEPDDAWWFWEKLMEADGLIVSSPIFSRTVPARLKLLMDRLLGPNADRAIVEKLIAMRRRSGAGGPVPAGRAGAQAASGWLHRGGWRADPAVEDPGAADHARPHVLDADGGRRPVRHLGGRHAEVGGPR